MKTRIKTIIATLQGDPYIKRVRHELKIRNLVVRETQRLTPHMIRITLGGEELETFHSPSPDDHVKIFLPTPAGAEIVRRDYTPRSYDTKRQELVINFVIHDGGPAAEWALGAERGDPLTVAGPRGSKMIAGDIRNWLLIGDETALPAIGRRIEEVPMGVSVTTIVTVPSPEDRQSFVSRCDLAENWLYRPLSAAADPIRSCRG